MKRLIFLLIFTVFLIPIIAASITISPLSKDIYNLGDSIKTQVEIFADSGSITGKTLTTDLICDGFNIPAVDKQGIPDLNNGEGEIKNIVIHINRDLIGERTGATGCVLKFSIGDDNIEPTKEFSISDYIGIIIREQKIEAAPKEIIILEGDAIKDNGQAVQGIAELIVIKDNETVIELINTVKNGYFYLNFSLSQDSKAGQYLVQLNIYEKALSGEKTNKGFINYNLLITQVPTSLEIVFDTSTVEPGTDLRVKTILHDQTGEPIETTSIITIKNQDNDIIEQSEKSTGQFLELPIAYNEPVAEWKIVALSNRLTSEASFNITKKEDVEINLVNTTITITNTGNVPYCNKSVLIKIGNESLPNIDVCLEVDEKSEYFLTAPEGEYQVNIISEGEEKISRSVMLTGRAIDIKEISKRGFVRHPLVWIFLIAILGFVAFLFFKKGYKRNFVGYITKRKKSKEATPLIKGSLLNTRNKAEISLSIKGDKQNVSIVCLKIKNLKEIGSKKGIVEESLQKIVGLVEEKKGYIYENNENLFFIFAPVNTKTFSNERTAIEVAQKIESALTETNRLYKNKIDFGIGLNYGTIIAKKEKGTLQFMSMGTLITTAKKTASASKGAIFLGEKMNDKLRTEVKTEKEMHGNTKLYKIKEVKSKGDHKNFLNSFVKRLEKEKKEKEDKDKKEKESK